MSARAVLFSYTAEGKVFADAFDSGQYPDPELQAEMLQAVVEEDFPGAIFSIGMNEEARDIMAKRRMKAMGFTDDELD